MRKPSALVSLFTILLLSSPLLAWNETGHMTVAYVAYRNLTPETRVRVDELVKRNPMYHVWIAHTHPADRGLVAFLDAATWPDCIKGSECPGYHADGTDDGHTPPTDGTANQNIGYDDMAMHKYWHYVDEPFSPAHLPTKGPKSSNALLQIRILAAALSDDVVDDIKSYDIAWLEHLVGDVHQPLHCTSRFTRGHPEGDRGGDEVKFCNKPCRDTLHSFWDGVLGSEIDIASITRIGEKLLRRDKPAGADEASVDVWINEGFLLAQEHVYIFPISDDEDVPVALSPRPSPAYAAHAKSVAEARILLAGYRLAALLNQSLLR
jgi:hypothetical protein